MPGAAVHRLAEQAAAGSGEQPPVGCGAVAVGVDPEHPDQDGRDGDLADCPVGPVLEAVYIALTVVLLAASWGLVRLCERV